jgi:ribonuclease R
VHRALIAAHGWGDDGLTPEDEERLEETAVWISETERRSMLAERDTTDRYLAAFLSERVGAEFEGRISGIARFGLFVKLNETGADGIIPLSQLGREYWRYDERDGTLKGEDSGRVIAIGMPCKVALVDATAVTGGLTLEMLELDGKPMPKGGSGKSRPRGRNGAKPKSRRRKVKRQR